MTLINYSKSFTFFVFFDYDLLEKERTEIRHLIFNKRLDYCSKRQKQCTRLYYRRLSFHNDENKKTEIILGSCASESEKTREKIPDALLRMILIHCCKNRDHYVYEWCHFTLCLPFLLYTYNYTCIPIYILIDS